MIKISVKKKEGEKKEEKEERREILFLSKG